MSSSTPMLRNRLALLAGVALLTWPLSHAIALADPRPEVGAKPRTPPTLVIRDDLFEVIEKAGFDGAFALLDPSANTLVQVNAKRCSERFTPASTFKIFISLAALEFGAIESSESVMKWDGVNREIESHNQDLSLRDAFRFSANWPFTELLSRIDPERLKQAVADSKYGNMDTSGSRDWFWVDGALRISPNDQVEFLRRLDEKALPFSLRTIDTVREMMVNDRDEDSILRGKTGWSAPKDQTNVGWFVGSLERNGKCLEFAFVLTQDHPNTEVFAKARRDLAEELLRQLGHVVPHSAKK